MSAIDSQSLTQILSAYAGVTEEEAASFLEAFTSVVTSSVSKGEDVEVQGLGTFSLIDTHSEMKRVALNLSETIKNEVNSPFSFLEPFVISKGKTGNPTKETPEEPSPSGNPTKETLEEPSPSGNPTKRTLEEPSPSGNPNFKKSKLPYYIVAAIFGLILLVSAFAFWRKETPKPTSPTEEPKLMIEKEVAQEKDTVTEENTEITEQEDTIKEIELSVKDVEPSIKRPVDNLSHRKMDESGNFMTFILEKGERLTLISLRYFGSKEFWPYIYEVNTDKLKSPDNVMAGMKLYLPDPTYFDIDASDEKSIEKAHNRGNEILNK
ncbi:MAG: HU family DNA-binding protein [Bacteroidales bacterium]|nr:HU family DNA-binding protein [Bacteroidales bacterium]